MIDVIDASVDDPRGHSGSVYVFSLIWLQERLGIVKVRGTNLGHNLKPVR